ncbi:hypothetical protein ACH44C_15180 [Streptomyces purpureus]|uniref:hypothetical protein n=1 Tax=Streptomyces purpureus TaxID=1951 RepID=UPI00037136B8|nr:hypothetical protein [Streptomyces purpureus]
MGNRTPNVGLAGLLTAANWTQGQLAAQINRIGTEAGQSVGCTKFNVNKWVGGTIPRKHIRPLILEAFARKLARPVTHEEAGWPPPVAESGVPTLGEGDTVEGLVSTGRADMDPERRKFLATSLYSAALPIPMFRELVDREESNAAGRTTRIGAGEVATVRTMTERIADILDELGGAHARPMAAAFLVNTVAPYLRADAPESVKSSMLAAASDLVYLTGWMAMYERDHGLGQRYYLRALELAGAANDHVTYCRTLRGMALQAANLKHASKALELADSAAEAAPKAGPRLHAFLAGQQAHGAALVGDRRQAFARLRETEAALSKADNRRDAIGGYDLAAYFFHVSSVNYALGDIPTSVKAMQDSNRVRPPVERQGRAHANGLLAQRQLEMGHLEAACGTWGKFLDDYEQLSSSRADEHFEIMERRLRSYQTHRAARELRERAVELARRKAAA